MKHAGGRPSKFNKDTLNKARKYIASCIDEFKIDMKNKKILSIGVNLPKAEGMAKYLGVRRETLYDWAKKNKEFSNILEALNQEQIMRLIDGGLSGRYNSTIAKLVLAKHGYKDESKQIVEDENTKSIAKSLEKIADKAYDNKGDETTGDPGRDPGRKGDNKKAI